MYMKLHNLVGRSLLKNRRNYKRRSKYETGYSADNMVYRNMIKGVYEDVPEDEDMNPVGPSYDVPKYLYHATFTKNVPSIKQKGLLQFQPSLWIKGPGGSRYNEEAGIFAFDDPEDALNWAGKMAWEFRDTDKDISIVRIDMEDEIWDDDPAEDPFVSNKGRALRSGANIKADRIVDAIRVDDLGKPGDLGISRDEWLAQVTPKLREDTIEETAGVGIVTKQNATKDVPVGGEYNNLKKLRMGNKPKVHTEGDMEADHKAGIKWVDDPDWKRLHDIDDRMIQAYMDHKKPKEELHEGINDPHIFKAVFMAGGPGSGKSHMARELLGGSGLKAVNTDQALEYLMAKHDLDPKMPDEEQEERDVQRDRAKELTSKRSANYIDGRLGLIIDGTAKDYEKIAKAKKDLEDLGYETRMVFVNTDLETAQERNMKRPERSVPAKLVRKGWEMAQENAGKFQMLFGQPGLYIIENSENSENAERINKVHANMRQWLLTPVTNREALDWMDQQTGFSEGLASITEDACGDCFSKAGRALIDTEEKLQDNTTLVHALVRGQGKLEGRRFPHAWTEMGDVVFDNANGNNIVMRKEQYYALGGVEETKGAFARYEHYKGLSNMLKHGHWGPWDLDESLNEEEKPEHSSSIANALEGKSPHKKGTKKYKKHMAAMHANM